MYMHTHTHTHTHTLECNNQFVKVEYDPSTTTISCTFENELDMSPKSCSVKYGMCDQEMYMYFAQNNTTDSSPSTVTLKLNTTATRSKTCYVVMASNDTHTVMVKGNFENQLSSDSRSGTIIVVVICAILLLLCLIVVTMVVIVFITYVMVRRKERGMFNLKLINCTMMVIHVTFIYV